MKYNPDTILSEELCPVAVLVHVIHQTFSGLPAEAKEAYRNAASYYEFDVKGDEWSVKNGSEAFPGQEKTYNFTVGKPFDADMLDGSKFKVNIIWTCFSTLRY